MSSLYSRIVLKSVKQSYSLMQSDGTVIAEMSSWIALTGNTGMKTAFETNNMKSKCFGIFIIKITKFKID